MHVEDPPPGSRRTHLVLVGLFALLILGSTVVPLIHGLQIANGRTFTGAGYDTVDHGYYLSIMQQGANGAWKVLNLFTTESEQAHWIHTFYVFVGKLAGMTGTGMPVAYHVSRLVVGCVLVFVIWHFLRKRLDLGVAALALGFVFISSGLGWLPFGWKILSVDLWFAETNTYLTMYYWPHITYALILKTVAILCLFAGIDPFRARYAVLAGICCALIVFDHTFGLFGIAATYVVYLSARYLIDRKSPDGFDFKPWISFFGIVLAIALPAMLVMLQQVRTDPMLARKMGLRVEEIPSLVAMLSGYGILAPLCLLPAIFKWRGFLERHDSLLTPIVDARTLQFLYAWAGSTFFSVYVFQGQWFARRMILGAHIPIAILAAIGTVLLLRRLSILMPRAQVAFASCAVVAFSGVTQVVTLQTEMAGYDRGTARNCRFFIEQREIDEFTQLGKSQPPDVVIQPIPGALHPLSPDPTTMYSGPYIPDLTMLVYGPWLTQHRQRLGHPWETPDFDRKLEELMVVADQRGPGVLIEPPDSR